jgi:hypothetical protein
MNGKTWALAAAIVAGLGMTACDGDKPVDLAPSATTLQDTKAKTAGAMEYSIETKGSKVNFTMDAPREKIRGKVVDMTRGSVQIDLSDLTKTTAHLYVDLKGLELFQQRAGDDGKFADEEKQPLQNEHAREWLEIGSCETADDKAKCEAGKKKNENIEFVLEKVETDKKDLTKVSGDTRTVKAKITGKFLLHQHAASKTAEVEIIVKMKGDKPVAVSIKTTKPFAVDLAKHDVRPRTAFGKLAEKTLDILINEDKKVAKEARVSIDFTATYKGVAKKSGGGDTKPASSGAK